MCNMGIYRKKEGDLMKGKFLFVDVVNNRNPKRGNSECNISEIPNQILYFSRLIVSLQND